LLKEKRDGTHLTQAREHYTRTRKSLDHLADGKSGKRATALLLDLHFLLRGPLSFRHFFGHVILMVRGFALSARGMNGASASLM
jgi:hypothetical protein